MTKNPDHPSPVDRWLRDGLEPESGSAQRISKMALHGSPPRLSFLRRRWPILVSGTLTAVVLTFLWIRSSPPPKIRSPIRIANAGDLVTVVHPGGSVWLYSETGPADDDSPRLIITLGENNAN